MGPIHMILSQLSIQKGKEFVSGILHSAQTAPVHQRSFRKLIVLPD